MSEKKYTTKFSHLADLIFGKGNFNQPTISDDSESMYPDGTAERKIIKASSNEELASQYLQNQQQNYINKQWQQVAASAKDKNLIYETNRLAQYQDYQLMESYPTISAALDLLSEEATTVGQDGKMLTISSSNKAVKQELERLFYYILDVNTTLQFWARNLVKYGDNFVFLVLDQDKGILGAKQLSNIDVQRKEEEIDGKVIVNFEHRNAFNLQQQYTIFQVAHFRLLGDDRRVPYGMSVLDKVRRTWKMLTLVEDSMMVYRISRAAERRVYKVDVGNIPPEDIPAYLELVASQTKKSRLIDPRTGDLNWKFNVATVDSDIYVPVRNSSAGSPIETLAGASNLSDIEDIKYLRENLFTGLGIPASFLSYFGDGGAGDGKSLSMLDIRFSRKINKIQQALIAELNNIAIIHLALLGGDFKDQLTNFTLSLANPSTQAELLKLETLSTKLDVYIKAVTPTDTGIKPMSESKAKMEILNMSEEEIMDDLSEQMIEAKIGDEIKSSAQLIKSSKMFDKMIKYYNAGFLGAGEEGNATSGDDTGGGTDTSGMGGTPEVDGLGDALGGGDSGGLGGGNPPAGTPPDMGGGMGALKEGREMIVENVQFIKDGKVHTERRERLLNPLNKDVRKALEKYVNGKNNSTNLIQESFVMTDRLEKMVQEIDIMQSKSEKR